MTGHTPWSEIEHKPNGVRWSHVNRWFWIKIGKGVSAPGWWISMGRWG